MKAYEKNPNAGFSDELRQTHPEYVTLTEKMDSMMAFVVNHPDTIAFNAANPNQSPDDLSTAPRTFVDQNLRQPGTQIETENGDKWLIGQGYIYGDMDIGEDTIITRYRVLLTPEDLK